MKWSPAGDPPSPRERFLPWESVSLSLAESEAKLLDRCLAREPAAWNDFVDRYLQAFYHTVHHAAQMRSVVLQGADVDDLVADILAEIVNDDFKVLRRFRRKSSLLTYLVVVARRVAVHALARRQAIDRRRERREHEPVQEGDEDLKIESEEEVEKLLASLNGREARLVRGFYLENKSYRDLSHELGIPENSVGPMLARVRGRLRKTAVQSP